jgi:signal transduction histidine kinase
MGFGNGIGFSQDHAEKIFYTFTRLNAKVKYEGTGLGLALCKKIAERHHGDIHARGEKDKGATFIVLLPLRQEQPHI